MSRHQHLMPFGAELRGEEGVTFRLWAPAASRVNLSLESKDPRSAIPMEAEAEGWFVLTTTRASAGSHYWFHIDGELHVPDPGSRFQPLDVHGPSEVQDPRAWDWRDEDWQGRPWEEAVVYEVHVGSFTPEGTFAALTERLEHLSDLGVTAVELMPIADFPGQRNWGYDGALLFAPDASYGRPEDLKRLVQCAHELGLMVFLDVVYNHFGPEGNYLHVYASAFFSDRHETPWGAGINWDGPQSHWARQFFIHNALYWLEEFRLDGLRLDAVHAIEDDSDPDIIMEIARAVRRQFVDRPHVHLILENYHNAARYLTRDSKKSIPLYTAQWNDDIHHALHVLVTRETSGFYGDYSDDPIRHLGRCLTEGFAYQGEASSYANHRSRGESSAHLPLTAFISFLQNHDQIGNRAFGERITELAEPEKIRAAMAVLLLAPSPPLLFMGQEWGACEPFPYFCDLGPELAESVTEGRRHEFAAFPEFSDTAARARIPDPMQSSTYESAILDWTALSHATHNDWYQFHREALALRHKLIVPWLSGLRAGCGSFEIWPSGVLRVDWRFSGDTILTLLANLSDAAAHAPTAFTIGEPFWVVSEQNVLGALNQRKMPAWSVVWFFTPPGDNDNG